MKCKILLKEFPFTSNESMNVLVSGTVAPNIIYELKINGQIFVEKQNPLHFFKTLRMKFIIWCFETILMWKIFLYKILKRKHYNRHSMTACLSKSFLSHVFILKCIAYHSYYSLFYLSDDQYIVSVMVAVKHAYCADDQFAYLMCF